MHSLSSFESVPSPPPFFYIFHFHRLLTITYNLPQNCLQPLYDHVQSIQRLGRIQKAQRVCAAAVHLRGASLPIHSIQVAQALIHVLQSIHHQLHRRRHAGAGVLPRRDGPAQSGLYPAQKRLWQKRRARRVAVPPVCGDSGLALQAACGGLVEVVPGS